MEKQISKMRSAPFFSSNSNSTTAPQTRYPNRNGHTQSRRNEKPNGSHPRERSKPVRSKFSAIWKELPKESDEEIIPLEFYPASLCEGRV